MRVKVFCVDRDLTDWGEGRDKHRRLGRFFPRRTARPSKAERLGFHRFIEGDCVVQSQMGARSLFVPERWRPTRGRRHCWAFRAPIKACALAILSKPPLTVPLRPSAAGSHLSGRRQRPDRGSSFLDREAAEALIDEVREDEPVLAEELRVEEIDFR